MNTGFQTASNTTILPSAEALAKAQARMAQWQEKENHETSPSPQVDKVSFPRLALHPVVNDSPSTPSPAGIRSNLLLDFASPLADKGKKPFKSPLITQPTTRTSVTEPAVGFANARSQHPLATSPITSSSSRLSPTSFKTPARPKGRNASARFVTPFKPGMRPGEPGRKLLDEQIKNPASIATPSAVPVQHKLNNAFFDLGMFCFVMYAGSDPINSSKRKKDLVVLRLTSTTICHGRACSNGNVCSTHCVG